MRGRRESRMLAAPAASRTKVESTRVSHYRYAEQSGLPCTMVFRLIRDLLGEPGFLATVARRFVTCELDLSVGRSGPHDFAVRPGLTRQLRPKASIASRAQHS